MFLAFFNLGLLIFIFIAFFFFTQGAIFVPSKKNTIESMVKLSNVKKGDRVCDLGSGDGRIVIAFAKKGAKSFGYEINPLLVWISRYYIKKNKLEKNATIYWKSFWKEDLSKYEIVTVFGIDYIMSRLERKLKKELKSGSIILVNLFPFPNWKPNFQ